MPERYTPFRFLQDLTATTYTPYTFRREPVSTSYTPYTNPYGSVRWIVSIVDKDVYLAARLAHAIPCSGRVLRYTNLLHRWVYRRRDYVSKYPFPFHTIEKPTGGMDTIEYGADYE